MAYRKEYKIIARDFSRAGEASSEIKNILKQLGLDEGIVKRASIVAYEAEMNVVIHSVGGTLALEIYPEYIAISAEDNGPGIKDLDLAMKEGFSTAPDEIREMGFGAGMGLPNIKKCSDKLDISTSRNGTYLKAIIYFK
ncbi:Anti-sigma regulatory factor (Ser/Thr protein kinase) [Caldanaerobius fijiensis DSM 17918]|uniref:Anti-sigma regulatory factor (Ser/Thr protein kinase) n=1 Tax=Caldanaerobius fijiensis DSM 17918 TaxID=1121256 RepID=A0A1M4WPL6_9THEO|nr:ATP-binding protein [Caldanaerobius fijiensis]SHE83251.1 Anti-sigma regulatory factor (Ser/Thr protein kinase) [Caldanaerobius fijiensis DSM 17918]